jgi:hypothetical protein
MAQTVGYTLKQIREQQSEFTLSNNDLLFITVDNVTKAVTIGEFTDYLLNDRKIGSQNCLLLEGIEESVPSMQVYVTKTYFDNTLSNYALKTDIPDVSNYVDYDYLNTTLSNYALKTDIPDVSHFVTLNYLQSNYYTKSEVDNKIPDTSEFITSDNLNNRLSNYYTKSDTDTNFINVSSVIPVMVTSINTITNTAYLTTRIFSGGSWINGSQMVISNFDWSK